MEINGDEIKEIENKKIVYAKRFLSFSLDEEVVKKHKKDHNYNAIITLDFHNLNELKTTYIEIVKISQLEKEKEVLFFPFIYLKLNL